MPMVPVNGTKLYYKEVGQGPPCLILHGGLGFDHTYLHPWLDPLGDRLRLIYYDQRGQGRSARSPNQTVTLEQLSRDAAELRRAFGLTRVSLLGHSIGAAVAVEHALRWPDHLSALILVAPVWKSFLGPAVLARARAKGATPDMLALLELKAPLDDEQLREGFRLLAPLYFHDFVPARFEQLFRHVSYNGALVSQTGRVLLDAKLEERLGRLSTPTLIVLGEQDFITSPSEGAELQKAFQACEIALVPNSGHFPYIEQPDVFFAVIHDWLSRLH